MMLNRNLYSKELKLNRKNLLIWSGIVIVFTILVMSMFPYMKNMGEEMAKMMSEMPKGITEAMGLNDKTFNSILGMYNTYYGIYIIVLLSIFACSTAATIISKEERDKTAEFLLTKPISRKGVFATKILALFTLAITAYVIQTITAAIFVVILGEEDVNWSVFITMHLHGFLLILFFTCVGLLLSMLVKARKSFMGMTVGIVFGSYFINTIAKASDTLSWIGYISPFHYLDFNVTDSTYHTNYLQGAIILVVSVILVIIAYKLYEKKDLVM